MGGFVAPILTYFAINYNLGFGIPMMIGTCAGAVLFIFSLLLGPETKGIVMVGDLDVLIHEPGDDCLAAASDPVSCRQSRCGRRRFR